MGAVSTLEDVIEAIGRFQTDLTKIQWEYEQSDATDVRLWRKSKSFLIQCESMLQEIWVLFDDVTSPELELALKNKDLKLELNRERGKLQKAEKKAKKFQLSSLEKTGQIHALEKELSELKKELKSIEHKYELLLRENPDTAMEFYSSEGRIKKFRDDS